MLLVDFEVLYLHGKEWKLGEMQDKWLENILHDIILTKSKIKHAKQNQVSLGQIMNNKQIYKLCISLAEWFANSFSGFWGVITW